MNNVKLNEYKKATADNQIPQTLIIYTRREWPSKDKIPINIQLLISVCDEILIVNGFILKGSRIIDPTLKEKLYKKIVLDTWELKSTQNNPRNVYTGPASMLISNI